MAEKVILLGAGIGTIAIVSFIIAYTKKIKSNLKTHVLRNKEVKKYTKER